MKNKKYFYTALSVLGIIAVMAIILHISGRIPICDCGYIKFWHGLVNDSGDSQHLFDWYSFTHVLHGVIFYFLIWLVDRKKKLSVTTKLLITIALAAGWEILENSPMIINRYRAATFSLNYYGDSIINSIGDVIAAGLGFWFAFKMKPWISVLFFIAVELMLAFVIRDNLSINIIMLIHPIEAIKAWQNGIL